MYNCLFCNESTKKPILLHVLGTHSLVIPMCSENCAHTLEEIHKCERVKVDACVTCQHEITGDMLDVGSSLCEPCFDREYDDYCRNHASDEHKLTS